jgi:hypothetical protein
VSLLIPAGAAQAADPGVHVDPKSPAGKEYALPLQQARRDAGAPTSSDSNDDSGLFGAGITPTSGGGGPRGGAHSKAHDVPSLPTAKPAASTEGTATRRDDPSATGLLAALIAVLIAGGGLAAIFLRRVQRA